MLFVFAGIMWFELFVVTRLPGAFWSTFDVQHRKQQGVRHMLITVAPSTITELVRRNEGPYRTRSCMHVFEDSLGQFIVSRGGDVYRLDISHPSVRIPNIFAVKRCLSHNTPNNGELEPSNRAGHRMAFSYDQKQHRFVGGFFLKHRTVQAGFFIRFQVLAG